MASTRPHRDDLIAKIYLRQPGCHNKLRNIFSTLDGFTLHRRLCGCALGHRHRGSRHSYSCVRAPSAFREAALNNYEFQLGCFVLCVNRSWLQSDLSKGTGNKKPSTQTARPSPGDRESVKIILC